jgi:N6-adenosine-specific RNA methylase IME4
MKLDADTLRKLPLALRIEIEENALRKPLTQSELAAEQQRILAALRKHKASGQRTDLNGTSEKVFSEVRATAIVGKLYGESHKQVEKRRAVCDAAKTDPEKFGKLQEEMDASGKVDRAFKKVQIITRQIEHAKRTEHGCTVADLHALAAAGKQFAVIYGDPPWPWTTWGGDSGKVQSSPDNHFNTCSIAEIAALPVAALAAEDCALLLWCTGPHSAIGTHIEIMRAWGFEPKTLAFDWVKQTRRGDGLHTGMGYFTRSNTEQCWLATKGSPKRLVEDVHQVVFAPVGAHSKKPEEVRRRIERLFGGPYLELYARRLVDRWTVWGNEVKPAKAEAAE